MCGLSNEQKIATSSGLYEDKGKKLCLSLSRRFVFDRKYRKLLSRSYNFLGTFLPLCLYNKKFSSKYQV